MPEFDKLLHLRNALPIRSLGEGRTLEPVLFIRQTPLIDALPHQVFATLIEEPIRFLHNLP